MKSVAHLNETAPLPVVPPRPMADLSEHRREQAWKLSTELHRRETEALRLYEPLPRGLELHKSEARVRTGRGSNRSGKTASCAVETSWAVTGQHPYLNYPKENGIVYLVGKNEIHIGTVFYKYLFRPGAFKIIRDEVTEEWRAFRPWQEYDQAYKEKRKDAPPLIPMRWIKGGKEGIAWEDKKKMSFKMVPLINGWEIWAFPSGGSPPQGTAIDLCWMDEHITDPEWFTEMSMRLLDRSGKLLWSATPQAFNPQLLDLSLEAERMREECIAKPRVEEFEFLLDDNPHIDDEEKQAAKDELRNDAQAYRVRILGKFASTGNLMYPNFHPSTHGFQREELPDREVPPDWCRYMIVDPGHTVCAVLFAAVPPPRSTWGDICLLYDELYITGCDGIPFGDAVSSKVGHQRMHTFIIDKHMARQTSMGDGRTVEWHYEKNLKRVGVSSEVTGHGFLAGCDNKESRVYDVRDWIERRKDSSRKLQVLMDGVTCALPNFAREISRYRKNVTPKGVVEDKPFPRQPDHLMHCLEYLAAHNPEWHPTRKPDAPEDPAYEAFLASQKKRNYKHQPDSIIL